MSPLTRIVLFTAAFLMAPAAAGLIGFRKLLRRDHLPPLAPIADSVLSRIPRPDIDPAKQTVVVVLGTDLTEITDALGPYEIFARTGRFNVVTAAITRQATLLTGGVRIVPHYSLSEITARVGVPAIVVVPNLPNARSPENRSTIDWLRQQANGGALIHSWCKGAMAVAETGLLDGKHATAHWGDIPTLEKQYPKVQWVRGVRWIEHGQFVMSAGITSGIDASLRVIIRELGNTVAKRVAEEIRYPNYQFAVDPRVEQYELGIPDYVLLANAAYRVTLEQIGVALYDGVGEIDFSNVFDAHGHVMVATLETIAKSQTPVVTAHGLTLFPALDVASDVDRIRTLDRVMVPGPDARKLASSLMSGLNETAPAIPVDYIHANAPRRFGLEPVLEDLARTSDVPTARFAQRRMEYRSPTVHLRGKVLPWYPFGVALGIGAVGLLFAVMISGSLTTVLPRALITRFGAEPLI